MHTMCVHLNKTCKNHKCLLVTVLIFCPNLKASPNGLMGGVKFWVGLQKYITLLQPLFLEILVGYVSAFFLLGGKF